MKKHLFYMLLVWGLLAQVACTEVREKEPVLPVDTTTVQVPLLSISVNEDSSAVLKLDSLLPQNEPYTLQFGPFKYGEITIENGGKRLRYKSITTKWKIDSTEYEFCRKGRCRKGIFKVVNLNFVPDTTPTNDTLFLPKIGPFYLGYLGTLDTNLIPVGVTGKLISLKHRYYTANIQAPDSTNMLYFSAGGGTLGTYGFDDVSYIIKTGTGVLYKGSFEMILGDTCEAQARNDSFMVSGNSATWQAATWFENDQPCSSVEENYKIRISLNAYGDVLKIPTSNGELTDTLDAGGQKLKYRRTNLSATEDTFWYYVKAGFNDRITRAKVKLKFQ